MKAIQDAAAEEAKQRLAEKAAKKAAFNAEYDVGEALPPSYALGGNQHAVVRTTLLG